MGGVVEDDFESVFGFRSLSGLYDRFFLGLAPQPHSYDYRPPNGEAEIISRYPPEIDDDVWEVLKEWKTAGISGRAAEIGLKGAWICAAVDGRPTLKGCELGPSRVLADYETKAHNLFKPNPGQNPDAQCAFSIMKWLEKYAPAGEWVKQRDLSRGIHSWRLGPGVFNRALQNLQFNSEILLEEPQRLVRLLPYDAQYGPR